MTTYAETDEICSCCGAKVIIRVLTSTSFFGASDLDFRPPAPARYTVGNYVQECNACGYCAPDLAKPIAGAVDVIRQANYREISTSDLPATIS